MTTYYRCPECDGNGHHLHLEAEVPYCQTCYDMIPVTIDYEAAEKAYSRGEPSKVIVDAALEGDDE